MGAMDLAICWDYRPRDPRDEPQRPAHIDGSSGSAAPAVFTLVKTPRAVMNPGDLMTHRSGGVFTNTLGDPDFFDRDIARQQANFGCKSAPPPAQRCSCDGTSGSRPRSMARQNRTTTGAPAGGRLQKRCKSSPNLSQIANHAGGNSNGATSSSSTSSSVGHDLNRHHHHNNNDSTHHQRHRQHNHNQHHHHHQHQSRANKMQPATNHRPTRLCEQQESINNNNHKGKSNKTAEECNRAAFKAGIPNSNASGTCTSFDSGCGSTASSSSCSSTKTAVCVPKPRHPYAKRDYVIDTLAPPFACWRGGAGQGGYPEHNRLASVYQHAYKPIEQRKRPLLATVYQ